MPQPKKQKRPARITSFPFFPRLPLELQDEIWKFALGNDVPAAHIVNIDHEHSADQSPAHLLLQRLVATGYSSRFMKPVSPPRQALVQTCRCSRLIVEKIIKTWECYYHPHAQPMNYSCLYEYDKFHSKTYMAAGPPRPRMYTSRDLFVISNPWIGGEYIYNGSLPSQSISVKYAAIPYPHDASGCWVHVLMGDTSPERFQYGDRVYHEISDVLLMKLNQLPGLSQAVTDLEKVAKAQRAKNGGDKSPLVIRFITW
ncbi:hypothetical protein FGSG_10421 [Fusarium graminearum PH-1]|uniref:Chromosome 1, complete genome n=1 Tax=Gibberella zeae (strain ATCC MYA-4620 / CBS 123657 / FGSC 9075 / NRRL 31084 / PH-1) TaxID=229533 RepID=I1S127_GIBZE|nr:hypothetical protein FGSG_10421 [Fusarium graminearum PH-1]ESU17133.1 hypothetical protein FGSG_10421 [Fusarium graminearum PH-1]EYB31369.1 hypothetical protein FG05_10421 [Fusarium graminearum]CEF75836.1 unnamed protein product [Fusarium graminearum]|eukprot:XP_011319395.1 hypothetical protein FGSG_10421 [Fusarium graminearum PH-1]